MPNEHVIQLCETNVVDSSPNLLNVDDVILLFLRIKFFHFISLCQLIRALYTLTQYVTLFSLTHHTQTQRKATPTVFRILKASSFDDIFTRTYYILLNIFVSRFLIVYFALFLGFVSRNVDSVGVDGIDAILSSSSSFQFVC